jgi:hypothetical protein
MQRKSLNKAHLFCFIQQRLCTWKGAAVERLGIAELTFELTKLASGLIELGLLQQPIFIDRAQEIRQRVPDCLRNTSPGRP